MIIDLQSKGVVERMPSGGARGQLSWELLTTALRLSGQVRHNERLTHLEIDWGTDMLRFRSEKV